MKCSFLGPPTSLVSLCLPLCISFIYAAVEWWFKWESPPLVVQLSTLLEQAPKVSVFSVKEKRSLTMHSWRQMFGCGHSPGWLQQKRQPTGILPHLFLARGFCILSISKAHPLEMHCQKCQSHSENTGPGSIPHPWTSLCFEMGWSLAPPDRFTQLFKR